MLRLNIREVIPGSILPADHVHWLKHDNTCSRCRKVVPDDEVPLLMWVGKNADDMLIYCEGCQRGESSGDDGRRRLPADP